MVIVEKCFDYLPKSIRAEAKKNDVMDVVAKKKRKIEGIFSCLPYLSWLFDCLIVRCYCIVRKSCKSVSLLSSFHCDKI